MHAYGRSVDCDTNTQERGKNGKGMTCRTGTHIIYIHMHTHLEEEDEEVEVGGERDGLLPQLVDHLPHIVLCCGLFDVVECEMVGICFCGWVAGG